MWKTAEEIGEELRIAADAPNTTSFWLILAHRNNDERTLFIWCDPTGYRAIAFKNQSDAEDLAETLATDGMEPFLSFQEDFKKDDDGMGPAQAPEKSPHFVSGNTTVH